VSSKLPEPSELLSCHASLSFCLFLCLQMVLLDTCTSCAHRRTSLITSFHMQPQTPCTAPASKTSNQGILKPCMPDSASKTTNGFWRSA